MKKKTIVFLCTVILACGISVSAHALPYSGDHNWYVDGDAIWTAWRGQWVEYHVPLHVGNWSIGLNAMNHGNLGSGWHSLSEIGNSLTSEMITIPASDWKVNFGFVNVYVSANNTYKVKYSPPLDANIPNPEPTTMLLVGTGLIGLAGFRKKFKK